MKISGKILIEVELVCGQNKLEKFVIFELLNRIYIREKKIKKTNCEIMSHNHFK